jgi:hypothetical protein
VMLSPVKPPWLGCIGFAILAPGLSGAPMSACAKDRIRRRSPLRLATPGAMTRTWLRQAGPQRLRGACEAWKISTLTTLRGRSDA